MWNNEPIPSCFPSNQYPTKYEPLGKVNIPCPYLLPLMNSPSYLESSVHPDKPLQFINPLCHWPSQYALVLFTGNYTLPLPSGSSLLVLIFPKLYGIIP